MLKEAVIRVLDPNGKIVGAGCLLTNRHAVTCAHVAADALLDRSIAWKAQEKPKRELQIDFPFSEREAPNLAKVITLYPMLDPLPRGGLADLALLEIQGELPSDAKPARLAN